MTTTTAATSNRTQGNHKMTTIGAHHAGFGMYQPGEYNGDMLNNQYDWRDALNDAGAEFYTVDDADIPAEALAALNDVKGSCYNEPSILVAVRTEIDGEEYWQIEGVEFFDDLNEDE